MRRTSQKWYNMQYINMSGNLPMGIAENLPRVRYSAAYPGTDAPKKALLSEGSRTKCARRDRKVPRESVSFSR